MHFSGVHRSGTMGQEYDIRGLRKPGTRACREISRLEDKILYDTRFGKNTRQNLLARDHHI